MARSCQDLLKKTADPRHIPHPTDSCRDPKRPICMTCVSSSVVGRAASSPSKPSTRIMLSHHPTTSHIKTTAIGAWQVFSYTRGASTDAIPMVTAAATTARRSEESGSEMERRKAMRWMSCKGSVYQMEGSSHRSLSKMPTIPKVATEKTGNWQPKHEGGSRLFECVNSTGYNRKKSDPASCVNCAIVPQNSAWTDHIGQYEHPQQTSSIASMASFVSNAGDAMAWQGWQPPANPA